MALPREKLVNIGVFMRYAAESGKLNNIQEIMAFAETLDAVRLEIEAIDKANPPKQGETK